VQQQFAHLIRERVDQVLKRLQVERGRIVVSDRGALDYAIEARVETAVRRGGA
jgi:citrate lyase subunit gamma (acyl carrier protein)